MLIYSITAISFALMAYYRYYLVALESIDRPGMSHSKFLLWHSVWMPVLAFYAVFNYYEYLDYIIGIIQ